MTGLENLVVLDLDGTCLNDEPFEHIDPQLCDYLRSLGVAWAVNSDRYPEEIIRLCAWLPRAARPAAILSMQRFIHVMDGGGEYEPDSIWNESQRSTHQELWEGIAPFFNEWREQFAGAHGVLESLIDDQVFSFRLPA